MLSCFRIAHFKSQSDCRLCYPNVALALETTATNTKYTIKMKAKEKIKLNYGEKWGNKCKKMKSDKYFFCVFLAARLHFSATNYEKCRSKVESSLIHLGNWFDHSFRPTLVRFRTARDTIVANDKKIVGDLSALIHTSLAFFRAIHSPVLQKQL